MGVLAVDIVMVQLTLTEYVAIEFYHWILVLEFFFSIIKIKYLSANFKCENLRMRVKMRSRNLGPENEPKDPIIPKIIITIILVIIHRR